MKFLWNFSLDRLSKLFSCMGARFGWVAIARLAVGLAIALGLLTGTSALAAITFTVTTLADTTGSCTDNSCTTLRAAIAAANSSAGNTINFTGLSGTITLTSALPKINESMTIAGPGANSLTISGNGAYQIFNIGGGGSIAFATVAISGLTLANGHAAASPFADFGGAIQSTDTLTVTDCTFSGNSASASGGAIYNSNLSSLTVNNSTFSGNSAPSGGAIYSEGTLTVIASSFSENSANSEGGAIDFVDNANNVPYNGFTLTVIDSSFSENSVQSKLGLGDGGAIGITYGIAPIIANNTFSVNSADIGGAIYINSGTLTLNNNIFNNIFIGNSASLDYHGAGIFNFGSTVKAEYNLYYQNFDAGTIEDDCARCTSNTNAISGNPNLLPLGFYGGPTQTQMPQPGSPAICAGSYADVPSGITTDQRGFPLTNSTCSNGGVDVGAVQTGYMQVTTTADSDDGSCTASLCSLRDAITAANATNYGGDIAFASGVTGTITLTSALPAISQSMVILGPGAGTITISGNNAYQIFDFSNSSATMAISGLTFANAYNQNTAGGAIFNSGNLTVTNSTFSGNSEPGNFGGAIFNSGNLTVTNSTFSGNSGTIGGAIYSGGNLTVTNSTFSENFAPGFGYGGAIYNGSSATVTDSSFSDNSADFAAGAIANYGTMTVDNDIFTGNTAIDGGAAIYNFQATLNADHNLYYQNLDSDGLEDDCLLCTTNTNAIAGSDPLLAALGSYGGPTQTMLLEPGSPAICAGSTTLIPSGITTDQRGFSRTTTYSGTACVDLGAVQTAYTAVAFSAVSYSGTANQPVNPAPVVTVTENGQNVGSVFVDLAYSGTGSVTGLGPVTTVGGTGATFSNLVAAANGAQGTLSVTLPITASGNAVQPAALTASATLDIRSVTQTITFAAPTSLTYGGAPIALTATGGASGNPVVFTLDASSTPGAATLSGSTLTIHGVGTIVIDANQAAGSGYTAAPQVQQSIVVSPASLSITTSSPTVTYGSAVPTITPTFGTFFNGDTTAVLTTQPTCVTVYTTTSAVGSSPSTSCSGAAAANYTFTYINGSVIINAATQAITFATPSALAYGSAPITLAATGGASGNPVTFTLAPNSTPGAATLSGSTLTIHGVGTVVIDANQAAGADYTAAPQVQQSIVVSPASLTITGSSPTVTYGSAVPTITPIFGTFVNGDTSAVLTTQPTCVTAYITTSAVGSSPSTNCSGAAAANYTFTYINGLVTIKPASLTITASSPTVTYGSAIPTITPIFGAFFNGDTSAVLTTQPTCVTAYTTTSAVGSSPSTSCSGAAAANYIFTYVNGSVTVNAVPTFTIGGGGGSTSLSIEPGATTGNTVSIPVTPTNGFTGTVNLTCSISPVAASDPPTCSLSPAAVTITGPAAQTSTLTIATTASTVSENRLQRLLWRSTGTTLALVLIVGVPRRRRNWLAIVGMLTLFVAIGASGCGGGATSSGGGGTGTGGNSGTTPGTYTITVTATSGSITGTAETVTLTVQ